MLKNKTFRRLKRLCFLLVDLWAPHGEDREREGGLAAEPNWVVEVVWWRPNSMSHSKIRTQHYILSWNSFYIGTGISGTNRALLCKSSSDGQNQVLQIGRPHNTDSEDELQRLAALGETDKLELLTSENCHLHLKLSFLHLEPSCVLCTQLESFQRASLEEGNRHTLSSCCIVANGPVM